MHDIQVLRQDIDQVSRLLMARGYQLDVNQFMKLEARRKELQIETERLQSERNKFSKEIGNKKKSGEDASSLMDKMSTISESLSGYQDKLSELQLKMRSFLAEIPNIPHASVPEGKSEKYNEVVRQCGDIPRFEFEVKDHVDIGERLGQLNFEAASKISGSRFSVLTGELARLHRALIQFMLDVHTKDHGYLETYVPYVVNSDAVFGTGQLPKFEADLFSIQRSDGTKSYLIPTAEVPVTNLVREQIIELDQLPIRYVCHTPCFRSEAGSYGKDTRGMIRQHQFDKVELVQICTPESSYQILEELTRHAEEILKRLKLAYRVVSLCGGDIGFSAAKTYDLEVWLPSQETFREISSCSNFESFQARRMMARYKKSGEKPKFLHTLNGSALAIGRTLVAILENYQNSKGDLEIPEVLQMYMGGAKKITVT